MFSRSLYFHLTVTCAAFLRGIKFTIFLKLFFEVFFVDLRLVFPGPAHVGDCDVLGANVVGSSTVVLMVVVSAPFLPLIVAAASAPTFNFGHIFNASTLLWPQSYDSWYLFATLVLAANLVADRRYAVADPRIRDR